MNYYKITHANGVARIKAWNKMQAQIKFRKKYKTDFIKIEKERSE